MYLQSHALRSLTAADVASAYEHQQCVVLRKSIDAQAVQNAFKALERLMRDPKKLSEYPFDPYTRLGYTPPGVETLQRDSENRDWNRAMFDFSTALSFNEAPITTLYREAVRACEIVLARLDEAYGTQLARLPKGGHTLRSAQYLLGDTDSKSILFPRHRDFSLLTAFIGSDASGLEVEVDEEWHPANLEYGDLLIGAGTPLTQFDARLRPLWHRVVGGTDYRLSSFLFFDLRADVTLPKSQELYGDMLTRVLKSVRVGAE